MILAVALVLVVVAGWLWLGVSAVRRALDVFGGESARARAARMLLEAEEAIRRG